MTSSFAPSEVSPPTLPETAPRPRQRELNGFDAALAAALTNGLTEALRVGDHPRAVSFINRGFAEGSPQLGCDLLCQAIAVVGSARTWTVQIAPLSQAPPKSPPIG